MSEMTDRRAFNVALAYAMLGGAAITVTACGGGGGSTTGPSGGAYGSTEPPATPAPTPTATATATATAPTSPPATPAPTATAAVANAVGIISANHGHKAVITGAQILAGGALTLDIMGAASHGHTITLSGSQVMTVGNGGTVTVQSTSTNAHTHDVTFN
jgi:hypothetical protein